MKYYTGKGLLNSAINKLPFELHIPTYNFCGPGTKLEKRLRRGDRGINGLDDACRLHDMAYSEEKDLGKRHQADQVLAQRAMERFRSKDASAGERIAALGVAGAMRTKVKLGMGIRASNFTSRERKQLITNLQKIKNSIKTSENYVDNCMSLVNGGDIIKSNLARKYKRARKLQNENLRNEIERKLQNHEKARARKLQEINNTNNKRKLDMVDHEDNEIPIKRKRDNIKENEKRKRKELESEEIFTNKKSKLDLDESIHLPTASKRKLEDDDSDNEDNKKIKII